MSFFFLQHRWYFPISVFFRGGFLQYQVTGPSPWLFHLDTGDSVALRCRGALHFLCAPSLLGRPCSLAAGRSWRAALRICSWAQPRGAEKPRWFQKPLTSFLISQKKEDGPDSISLHLLSPEPISLLSWTCFLLDEPPRALPVSRLASLWSPPTSLLHSYFLLAPLVQDGQHP